MKLSEIIDVFIAGDWGNESPSLEAPHAVSCVRGADIVPISNNEFTNIPLRYVSDRSFQQKLLKVGDIVIEKSGGSSTQSTGRAIYISENLLSASTDVVCSNFCVAFRVKDGWNSYFIYQYWQYLYNSGVFFNFEGKTSGIKNLQLDIALSTIEIEPYPIEKQIAIVNCLEAFEEKIALNRSINHNLETMAKQLYDYWFVQFDFPDENGKPYKSSGGQMVWNEKLKREIPGGWKVTNIGSILDKVFITPRLSTDEYLPSGTYPIIDQATDVYYAGFTEREEAVVNQYPAIVFGDHSCAVKYVNFPFVRGADGTQVILSKDSNIPIEYLYYALKGVKIGKGYARHFSFLKEQPVIVPSEKEVKDFEDTAQTFFEQITRNRKEILSLTKQRDELLPLLMNGQVSLNYDLAYQTSFFFLNAIVRSIACSCMDFISLVRFISSRNNAFTLFSAV